MKGGIFVVALVILSIAASAFIFHQDSSIYVNSENSDAINYVNELKEIDYNLEQSVSSFMPLESNDLDFDVYYGHKTDEIITNFNGGSYKLSDIIDYFQNLINKKYEMMKTGEKGDLREIIEFNYDESEIPNPGHEFNDVSLNGDQQIEDVYRAITEETCVDGILNAEEETIDCGGSCGACNRIEAWYPSNPGCAGGGTATLTIPENGGIASAVIVDTFSDDKIILYINDQLVYDEQISCNPNNHYQRDLNIKIGQYLKPGENTIRAVASCPCNCGSSNACALLNISYYE